MAFLGIEAPADIARTLSAIQVPGVKEPVGSLHITMFYFSEGDLTPEQMQHVAAVSQKVASTLKPFRVRTQLLTTFPKGEDGVPIICKIESPELLRARQSLATAFEATGIEYSKRFTYNPHLTLSYSTDPTPDRPIPLVEWEVEEVRLWGGSYGDSDGTVETFPLTRSLVGRVVARFESREL